VIPLLSEDPKQGDIKNYAKDTHIQIAPIWDLAKQAATNATPWSKAFDGFRATCAPENDGKYQWN